MPEREILEDERLTGFQFQTETNAEDREDIKQGVSLAATRASGNMTITVVQYAKSW